MSLLTAPSIAKQKSLSDRGAFVKAVNALAEINFQKNNVIMN
jgi:hypothetical protein